MRAAVLDPPLPSLCSTSATVLAAVPGEALSPSRSSTSTIMREVCTAASRSRSIDAENDCAIMRLPPMP